MAIGLDAYWVQFGDMKNKILGYYESIENKVSEYADIVSVGLVDNAEAARKAAASFRTEDVDVVFCHCATYCPSDRLILAVKDIDVPVVLLNIQSVKALDMSTIKEIPDFLSDGCTCACLPEMTAALARFSKRFDVITGYLTGDAETNQALQSWCVAASVRRCLRYRNIGFVGHAFSGMLDIYVDEVELLNTLGIYTHHIEFNDIIDEAKQASTTDIGLWDKKFADVFGKEERGDINVLCRYTEALQRITNKLSLFGVACHYAGNYQVEEEMVSALNPAFSMLMKSRIACTVEGDIQAAVAMFILKRILGSAMLAELYSMDFNDQTCIIGHSGAGDPDVSDETPLLKESNVFHGRKGKGYLTQFYPKAGPVTLLALSRDDQGFKLVAAEGICEKGATMSIGDTNCRVRFEGGLRNFVNEWASKGPSHHSVLGIGHDLDTIKRVAMVLRLPLSIVTVGSLGT